MPQDNKPKLQRVAEQYRLRVEQALDCMPIEDVRELLQEIEFELQAPLHLKFAE